MQVKTYLNQVDRFNRNIQYKLGEIYKLKVLATSISAVVSDDVRVKSSGNSDKISRSVIKLIELENEIDGLIDEYLDRKKLIIEQIEGIEDTNQYSVLVERYIERKPFDEIAIDMGYSRKQINRIHSEALKQFEIKYADFLKEVP